MPIHLPSLPSKKIRRTKTGNGEFGNLEWLTGDGKRKSRWRNKLTTVSNSLQGETAGFLTENCAPNSQPFPIRIWKSISTPHALWLSFCNYILHLKYLRHEPIITWDFLHFNAILAVITCSVIFLKEKKKHLHGYKRSII